MEILRYKDMKYADLPKERLNHLVKPADLTAQEWQVMLRMQQAQHEEMDVTAPSERYYPGEYRVRSTRSGLTYKVVYRGPKSPWNFCECMDFKTSRLGTCKHVEATRQWIADHHKRIHRDLPAYTSVYLSYRTQQRQVRLRIGTTAAEQYRRLSEHYFDELGELRPEAYARFGEFLQEAKAIDEGFRCYADALDFVVEEREAAARRKAIDENYTDEALTSLLRVKLYPYQREGVRFACKAGRAILADEMGLGKTVQAIATAEVLRREGFVGNVLVVCPTTLTHYWRREVVRLTHAATAIVVEGTQQQRLTALQSETAYKIMSYGALTAMLTPDAAPEVKDALALDMVVMDEVGRLKNWNTQVARAARALRSRYALMLSGTPIENRLEDLYSIVELVDQYLLAPYYLFRERYLVTDNDGRTVGYRHLGEIAQRLQGCMMRRLRRDVAKELPPRIDKNLYVPMTPEQRAQHHDLRQQLARLASKAHRTHTLSEHDRAALMLTLQQMRMVCDSTYVLDEHSRHDTKVEETIALLYEAGIAHPPAKGQKANKAVVFSQWERMTRLIAEELERSGIEFAYLHGGIPAAERQQLVDTFQTDEQVRVFLSTDTGATGLNLQAATLLINVDLPWNPATLEQRASRIYRIGQTENVEIVNLIAAGTIEEDMRTRLRFKASLFDGALDGGPDNVLLSDNDLQQLLQEIEAHSLTHGTAHVGEQPIQQPTRTSGAHANESTEAVACGNEAAEAEACGNEGIAADATPLSHGKRAMGDVVEATTLLDTLASLLTAPEEVRQQVAQALRQALRHTPLK